jgi:hypothetical protein
MINKQGSPALPVPATAFPSGDELLTPEETARRLKLRNKNTLAVWRCTHRYPLPFVRIGRRVFYIRSSLEAFIASNVVDVEER